MPLTTGFAAPASTHDSSSPNFLPPLGRTSAVHQPNLFPRLSTLAKVFAADVWVVLDDVQFARRDYQHRARIADLGDARRSRWLSLPTHLPTGRSTLICEARLANPELSVRRMAGMVHHAYRRSPHWPAVEAVLAPVLAILKETDRTAVVAEESTRALLAILSWPGQTLHSSGLPARQGRSERLADLAAEAGSINYLCGPGGLRYIDHAPFRSRGLTVLPFGAPQDGVWQGGRRVTALRALAEIGPSSLATELRSVAELHRQDERRLAPPPTASHHRPESRPPCSTASEPSSSPQTTPCC
ncbi:WbqC family protein [Kitasatospora sp. NPDC059827]|uniref:WbqC family protein n=1 Tax=Kitasatospora sp. NPDC059827 TaxID=3346964 RepID=UPI003666FC77